jgi:hypothetical protein
MIEDEKIIIMDGFQCELGIFGPVGFWNCPRFYAVETS